MRIIVLGRCRKIEQNIAVFNFKGYLKSIKIKQIKVKSSEYDWLKNKDYVMQLEVYSIIDAVLWATLIKKREL